MARDQTMGAVLMLYLSHMWMSINFACIAKQKKNGKNLLEKELSFVQIC